MSARKAVTSLCFLSDFSFVSFDIIIFKLASLFHGSLMESQVFFEDVLGTAHFLRHFKYCWMCSRGLGSPHRTSEGFVGVSGSFVDSKGVVWWDSSITKTFEGGFGGHCWSFKGFLSVSLKDLLTLRFSRGFTVRWKIDSVFSSPS